MQSSDQRHTDITSYRLDDLFRYCRELFTAPPNSGHGNLRAVFSELRNRLRQSLHFDYLSFALHDPTRNSMTVTGTSCGSWYSPTSNTTAENGRLRVRDLRRSRGGLHHDIRVAEDGRLQFGEQVHEKVPPMNTTVRTTDGRGL